MVIHHDAKRVSLGREGIGHADAMRGSGLIEMTDCPVHFMKGERKRQLVPNDYKHSDTPSPISFRIESDPGIEPHDPRYWLRLVGETKSEADARRDDLRDLITEFVSKNACAFTRQIEDGIKGRRKGEVGSELRRMRDDGRVESHKGKRGAIHYRLSGAPCACETETPC